MFLMGFYLLLKGIHVEMDKEICCFFSQWADEKLKYHMVKWEHLCHPRKQGRVGIIASHAMNVAAS